MKKLKQIHIVYSIVLLLFVIYSIMAIIEFPELHSRIENDYSIDSIIRTFRFHNVYKVLPFLLITIFAVFYKSKLSWFLLLSYFYYLICNIISVSFFDIKYEGELDTIFVFTIIGLLILLSVSLYILNSRSTFKDIYDVEKKSVMLYNFIAFILGCGISLFLIIIRLSRYYEDLQF